MLPRVVVVFSEGYKDLIASLFFQAVTKKAAQSGQARVLVLGDALQSVGASIRLGFMDLVLDEFSDWQLIFTGNDRSWLEQLRDPAKSSWTRLHGAKDLRMVLRWRNRGIRLRTRCGPSRFG